MREEYMYLKDEELEALLREVENGGMISSPVYLKDEIMSAVLKAETEKTVSGSPAEKNKNKITPMDHGIRKNEARRQLVTYSLKIFAAAAMAVFCLTAVPVELSGSPALSRESRIEQRIDKDIERYEKESKKLFDEEKEDKTGLKKIISSKSEELFHIWSDLTN